MKDWEDYKEYVKSAGVQNRKDIEQIEKISAIVSYILKSADQIKVSPKTK